MQNKLPVPYKHIYTATNYTKSAVYLRTTVHTSFMLEQRAREHVNKWQFHQSQSQLNNEAQLLLHCSFTKAWQTLQQGVSNYYYKLSVIILVIHHLIKLDFFSSFWKILHYQISWKSAHWQQHSNSMQTDGRMKLTVAINTTHRKEPHNQCKENRWVGLDEYGEDNFLHLLGSNARPSSP